ncbi:anaerobic ribonucleoside-triphosphate reductase [Halomonas sp. PR-M31]|uniref:anaerobic ribonucleoside-triphosphate reductase n=1 Tax=Halomonas sp. PR-M31 TaxID=1471202 RepID=UPI0006510772|nr:anaerobic ribonucleoside-triphosphate reductase [Halomonas sp. PR-M31]
MSTQSLRDTLPSEQRQRCEVWTRVMGYHRPVSQFNVGKQSEHRERRHFSETMLNS